MEPHIKLMLECVVNYDSVIGMDKNISVKRFLKEDRTKNSPATGN